MELIFDILKKLKNYEIRHIRYLLKASPFEFEKVGKLFDLVTRYKDREESWYSNSIYGKKPGNTFRVTKSRLKKILEEVVISDKSLTDYNTGHINALLKSRKRLLQGQILLGRGAYSASKNLLLQVVGDSRKFSLHPEHFQSELLLLRGESINMTIREFQRRSAKLLELNEIQSLVNESAILHYSVTNLMTHRTVSDEKTMSEISANVSRIREIALHTSSPVALYYQLLTDILWWQYQFEFDKALQSCRQYIELLRVEPAVQSQQRLGNANFQMSEISLRMGDLDQASQYMQEALSSFSPDETNYLIVLGTAFRIAFYRSDYDTAATIVKESLAHPRLGASKMRSATWNYFQASLLFRMGKFKEALKSLNNATALLSDKLGWNIGFRLLEIMIMFESGHYDLLDARILNMRQYVRRTHKDSELYRPMQLISILMEWHKNSLDLRRGANAISRKIRNLETFHRNIPFNPTSFELVRFEEWMKGKVGNRN